MIVHGNCYDADPALLAACDVQISDFPYSEYVHSHAMSSHTLASGGPRKRDLGYAAITPDDRAFAALVASLMPRWSVIFSDLESTHLWRDAMAAVGVEYVRQLDWIRWVQPQQSGDRPCNGCEAVLHFHSMAWGPRGALRPAAKHWNGSGGMTHYDTRGIRGHDKRQGQKPLGLGLTVVSAFSDPGERILDLTTGAGTFPLAARLLGREALGYEIDPEWAAFAADRELAGLCARDLDQARDWCDITEAECVRTMPAMQGPESKKTLRRAQARMADVDRVRKAIL